MGQACCGTKPDEAELNSHKTQGARGERSNYDPETQEKLAAVTMQRFMRGIITRRSIKAKYGFEARTAFRTPTYTQTQYEIQAARQLVMQIRS